MKITLKILLLTLTILALTACSAKKASNQKFSFKIAALQTGLSLNGGSFVRAINATSNTLIKLDANDSAEFEQGTWEFQTVSFEGPGAYAGRRFCGRAVGVKLTETQKDLSLTITEANCASEPFISLMAAINANLNTGNFLTIFGITPKSGSLSGGSTVTIAGSGFVSGANVLIGGKSCSGLTVVNPTTITCTVPSSTAGAVTVSVTNPDLQTTSAANFYTYRMAPVLNTLAPASGAVAGGTIVTLTGTGFVAGATVMFGSAPCIAPVATSSTSLTCTTPAYPTGSTNVVVTNPDGQMSGTAVFNFMPKPLITTITPNNVPMSGGSVITFNGSGFENVQSVSFDGVMCSNVTPSTSTNFTCITPVHSAGPSVITVTSTDGQSSTFSGGFMFNAPPTLSSIDMKSGPASGGTIVTINGAGFVPGATVQFDGLACGSVTFISAASLSCSTPSNSLGTKTITVTNPDTQSANLPASFTYRNSFVSTWEIGTANESITLPIISGFNYDFWVDWGDGSAIQKITSFSSPSKVHTYANPGIYTITINGIVEGWSFGAVPDSKLKIKTVIDFGDANWKNLNLAFYGCSNLTSFSGGVTPFVTDMSGMFKSTSSLTSLNVSSFNTGNVTNMTYMFQEATALTSLNLANFNTSKVTNMGHMFYGTTSLTNLNLSNFNTSLVTNMASMFGHTNILPSLDVSSFNTMNVTNMTMMFEQASGLTTLDLSSFNTSNVVTMGGMFNNANQLTNLNVSSFDTSKVTNMGQMFSSLGSLTTLNVSNFNTSNVTSMSAMFSYSTKLASLDLSTFNTSKVTNFNNMFTNTALLTSLNVSNWDITTLAPTGVDIFTLANVGLQVTCNQGGSPATGSFFGKSCY